MRRLAILLAAGIGLLGATSNGRAQTSPGCVQCSGGECIMAEPYTSANCECSVKSRCTSPGICIQMCTPIGVCPGCPENDGRTRPPMIVGPTKDSGCQPTIKAPVAAVTDSALFDLLDERFSPLGSLISSLDLVEGPFGGNMGWRPAAQPRAKLTPWFSFSGVVARAEEGAVRLSVSLYAPGNTRIDEMVQYEVELSKDLSRGSVVEKRDDDETHFSWDPEDLARQRRLSAQPR